MCRYAFVFEGLPPGDCAGFDFQGMVDRVGMYSRMHMPVRVRRDDYILFHLLMLLITYSLNHHHPVSFRQ